MASDFDVSEKECRRAVLEVTFEEKRIEHAEKKAAGSIRYAKRTAGKTMRELREVAGVSIEQLAVWIGVSVTDLTAMEKGKEFYSLGTAKLAALALKSKRKVC